MYQALYRKWRPKTFDEVVGQQHITDTLKNQIISGRLSHAYLFIGTRGTGKTTCARILAKALNCQSPVNGNPCCKCPACLGIDDGSVLDVVEIDAASNNGVDNVRQLRDEAVFSPVSVKKRVYIIDEVHMLSPPAFNALLKILEEPPEHLTFILATTELNKVPATILSRCQRHSFKRLDASVIAKHLLYIASQEHFELEENAAALIAGLSEGGMRDALSLLDQCSGHERIDTDTVYSVMGLTGNRRTALLMDHTIRRDTDSALALFSELWKDGKDPVTALTELNTLQRDCLMISVAPKTGLDLVSGAYSPELLRSLAGKLTKAELISRIDTVASYIIKIKDSKSPRLIAELCIISLCDPALVEDVAALRARIARLEASLTKRPVFDIPDDYDEPAPRRFESEKTDDEPEDDLDLSQFDEYQPEDDLLDRPVGALNPDAPENADELPQDSASLWKLILESAEASLPVGLIPILADPAKTLCCIDASSMKLFVEPGLFFNMIKSQDVILRLRSAASQVTGRSLAVTVEEAEAAPSAEKKPTRDINELKNFKETRFI